MYVSYGFAEVSCLGVGTQVYVYVLLFIRETLHTTAHNFALGDV